MLVMWMGVLMTIVSIILYAIGVVSAARTGLWIASVVIGGIALMELAASVFWNYSRLTRMVSIFFLIAQVVFITIIATVYFM